MCGKILQEKHRRVSVLENELKATYSTGGKTVGHRANYTEWELVTGLVFGKS